MHDQKSVPKTGQRPQFFRELLRPLRLKFLANADFPKMRLIHLINRFTIDDLAKISIVIGIGIGIAIAIGFSNFDSDYDCDSDTDADF